MLKNKLPDTGNGNTNMAVSVDCISKIYPMYKDETSKLYQSLWNCVPSGFIQKKIFYDEFQAINNISFHVKRGECFGIIGKNGSGKSTILQIIAGILSPTNGSVNINGKVTAILELGSGFNPNFTGIDNIFINGAISGFSRKEVEKKLDDILAFADIGDFIHQPVKFYSSGMFVRLAFAVQACFEPEILIIDEVLSVGDIFFQQKCHKRIEELLTGNTSVILVSHNMSDIEKYCSRVLVLDKGCSVFTGQPNEAVDYYYQSKNTGIHENSTTAPVDYSQHSEDIQNWPPESAFINLSNAVIIGDQDVARCSGIALCDTDNRPTTIFHIKDSIVFYYEFDVLKDIKFPVCGVRITNNKNINIHAKNTIQYSLPTPPVVLKGAKLRVRQAMQLDIAADEYTFSVYLGSLADHNESAEHRHSSMTKSLPAQTVILSVKHAGNISVNFNPRNISPPFYDYVDLKGECSLEIFDQTN